MPKEIVTRDGSITFYSDLYRETYHSQTGAWEEAIRKFGVITDTGCVTEDIEEAIPHLDGAALESNHDVEMLVKGPYPWYLKKRIMGQFGHLSNIVSAQLVESKSSKSMKTIFLSHLSQNNNTPDLAMNTYRAILKDKAKDIQLNMTYREKATGLIKI